MLAGLAARAEGWGEAEVERRLAGLAGRVAEAFPEIEVRRDGDRLVLQAVGLAKRAGRVSRGRRGAAPDPRLAMLAAWLATEGI